MRYENKRIFKSLRYVSLTSVIAFGLITIVATGGGGDGGGGPIDIDTAPLISNLIYSPESTIVGSGEETVTVTGSIDFMDDDADVSYLYVSIQDICGNSIDVIQESIEEFSGERSGTVPFEFNINTSSPGEYTFDISLLGQGSHSNVLAGDFIVNSESPPLFQSSLFFNTGTFPNSISVGDLDSDGHLDLVVANYESDNISVLLNNGNY